MKVVILDNLNLKRCYYLKYAYMSIKKIWKQKKFRNECKAEREMRGGRTFAFHFYPYAAFNDFSVNVLILIF